MAAPTTWSSPLSGGSATSAFADRFVSSSIVTHAGDYWFDLAYSATQGTAILRYATTPSGAWSTATMPAAPASMTDMSPVYAGGVQYDGANYAFATDYSAGTAHKARMIHTTDPTSTWSSYQFDATDLSIPASSHWDGTNWIITGSYRTASTPRPALITYATAVTGTYTLGTSIAATGFDPSAVTTSWTVNDVQYDGSTYVIAGRKSTADGFGHLRHATSIAGPWGTPTTATVSPVNVISYAGGYWTTAGPDPTPYYTDTPSGTWTVLGTASTGLTQEALALTYGSGYWVAVGGAPLTNEYPRVAYLESASPAGTYTAVGTAAFTQDVDDFLWSVAYDGDYFVATSSYYGELRYSMSRTPRPFPSPRGLPGNPRLRQRQTPIITK